MNNVYNLLLVKPSGIIFKETLNYNYILIIKIIFISFILKKFHSKQKKLF